MPVTLYSMSGSPYAWRAWLALVHKGVAFTHRTMSYDAGDFKSQEFLKLTPRRRVPVLLDDDFVLYESAAIVEYVEERWPQPSMFSADLRQRAVERRLVREVDSYFAERMERLVEAQEADYVGKAALAAAKDTAHTCYLDSLARACQHRTRRAKASHSPSPSPSPRPSSPTPAPSRASGTGRARWASAAGSG